MHWQGRTFVKAVSKAKPKRSHRLIAAGAVGRLVCASTLVTIGSGTAAAPKRLVRSIGAGLVGLMLSASLLATVGAGTANAGSNDCLYTGVAAANNYETRTDSNNRTYWFPDSAWRKGPHSRTGVTGFCRDTWFQRAGPVGIARGYYRQSNGVWTFASAAPTTFSSSTRYTLITNLLESTRFNHGHTTVVYSSQWF